MSVGRTTIFLEDVNLTCLGCRLYTAVVMGLYHTPSGNGVSDKPVLRNRSYRLRERALADDSPGEKPASLGKPAAKNLEVELLGREMAALLKAVEGR